MDFAPLSTEYPWACGLPKRMKVAPPCHSDRAGAGEESASSVLHTKSRFLVAPLLGMRVLVSFERAQRGICCFSLKADKSRSPASLSAVTRRVTRLDSAWLRSVELLQIVGSRTAVNARDDIVEFFFITLLFLELHCHPQAETVGGGDSGPRKQAVKIDDIQMVRKVEALNLQAHSSALLAVELETGGSIKCVRRSHPAACEIDFP